MKHNFTIELLKFSTIHALPEAWSNLNFTELLTEMNFEGVAAIPANELKDMCLMSLTDNEPDEAAKIVLEYIFKERLNQGQIDNLANEMLDEKMWEEYADLSLHEEFFNAGQLLYEAYNGKFPQPEAVRFQVKISSKHAESLVLLQKDSESNLIRLLTQGMPENTLINRLFDEQLESGDFNEAKDIIWQLKRLDETKVAIVFDLISSEYWFHDFKYVEPFEAELHVD